MERPGERECNYSLFTWKPYAPGKPEWTQNSPSLPDGISRFEVDHRQEVNPALCEEAQKQRKLDNYYEHWLSTIPQLARKPEAKRRLRVEMAFHYLRFCFP